MKWDNRSGGVMSSFLNWLLRNLSIAITREALEVSSPSAKATVPTFVHFKLTPGGPSVLAAGAAPPGLERGERLELFDGRTFDVDRAWALVAVFREAIRRVLPKNTLINPRVVLTGIDVPCPDRQPERMRSIVQALVDAGAREVVLPELAGTTPTP
jgi:hypothetical protein